MTHADTQEMLTQLIESTNSDAIGWSQSYDTPEAPEGCVAESFAAGWTRGTHEDSDASSHEVTVRLSFRAYVQKKPYHKPVEYALLMRDNVMASGGPASDTMCALYGAICRNIDRLRDNSVDASTAALMQLLTELGEAAPTD